MGGYSVTCRLIALIAHKSVFSSDSTSVKLTTLQSAHPMLTSHHMQLTTYIPSNVLPSLYSQCSPMSQNSAILPASTKPPKTEEHSAAGDHVDDEHVKGNVNVLAKNNTYQLHGPGVTFTRGGRIVPKKPLNNSLLDQCQASSSRTLM